MFSKKKKKPQISTPSNFEHRVHTGFDRNEGRYVGLPKQWASIVGNNQVLRSSNRPLPLIDPSEITPTEILDLKTIVRPHLHNNNSSISNNNTLNGDESMQNTTNGIVLPKTSHVARSNSLRSSSPPRARRDIRAMANVPASVPEEPSLLSQFPGMQREGIPTPVNTTNKPLPPKTLPKPKKPGQPATGQQYLDNQQSALYVNNSSTSNNGVNNNGNLNNNRPLVDQRGINGAGTAAHAISVRTELPASYQNR